MKHFLRKIKLKAHFKSKEKSDQEKQVEEKIFTKRNEWTQPRTHHKVEIFIQAVTRDIHDSKRNPLRTQNLSKGEHKALNDLQIRKDIIITHADKEGAVVIMDTEKYVYEVNRQLNN